MLNKATLLYEEGNITDSINYYEESLLYSSDPNVYYILGGIYFDLKDFSLSAHSFYIYAKLGYKRAEVVVENVNVFNFYLHKLFQLFTG